MNLNSFRITLTLGVLLMIGSMDAPRVDAQVIWERAQLDRLRAEKPAADTPTGAALTNLKEAAELAIQKEAIYSVTLKDALPPSGDRHDYLSYSRYWWPDPDQPDGLPFIRKDGVVNQELVAKGDRVALDNFCSDVQVLALAGYLFEKPRYSDRAATLVRAWFLDPATRMNPNLNFGQGVPGRAPGRRSGIIDTREFMLVLDGVELLDDSVWKEADQLALQAWFDDYQQWLRDSPLGLHAHKATNNHGSWYAAQRARYALFAGKNDLAKSIVAEAKKRIDQQFDASGNQVAELNRTLSLSYSVFNIAALSRLACVGEEVGEDLWGYVPKHGCGLKKAMDRLLPVLVDQTDWPHTQIRPFKMSGPSHLTMRLFSKHWNDSSYQDVVPKVEMHNPKRDFTLLFVGGE